MRNSLAFRLYKIPRDSIPILVKYFNKKIFEPINFDSYQSKQKIKLFFEIKKITPNNFGKKIDLYLDRIVFVPTRDEEKKPIKITPVFSMQLFEGKKHFENFLAIYGNKAIDYSIRNALMKYLENETKMSLDSLILVKPDFGKLKELVNEFPNLQQFCVKDVGDDQIDDIILKGNTLEKTPNYSRYVVNEHTKGDLNFVGLSNNNRIIYVGRDGSFYSREKFNRSNVEELIYTFLCRMDKIKVLKYRDILDNYLGNKLTVE